MQVGCDSTTGASSGETGEDFQEADWRRTYVILDKTNNEEQLDKDRGDVESEESGLQLVVDIMGESESATDEGE